MKAELFENRLLVWSRRDSRKLFSDGYYGKPIGVSKPKPDQIDVPLILDLMEGLYLLESGRIEVLRGGKPVGPQAMRRACEAEYGGFDKKYQVYGSFRDAGYVVSPGIKFGCDFAVYERGPGIDHAPYLVEVCDPREALTSTAVILAGRLASTVKKKFILAVPRSRGVEFVALDWWRA